MLKKKMCITYDNDNKIDGDDGAYDIKDIWLDFLILLREKKTSADRRRTDTLAVTGERDPLTRF